MVLNFSPQRHSHWKEINTKKKKDGSFIIQSKRNHSRLKKKKKKKTGIHATPLLPSLAPSPQQPGVRRGREREKKPDLKEKKRGGERKKEKERENRKGTGLIITNMAASA